MSLISFGLFSECLFLFLVLFYAFYKWSVHTHQFFSNKGVPFIKPTPLLGNFGDVVLFRESMFDSIKRFYSIFKDKKFFGLYEMRNPLLVIKDPELIKQITVKDFDHFVNHRVIIEEQDEPLFGNAVFFLKNQKWKAMRTTLTPSFTGSKMRIIFQLIDECCQSAMQYLKNQFGSDTKNSFELDMKEFFTRYTNDVIASSAFGVKINSLAEKDNEFYKMGRKAINFSAWVSFKFFLFSNFKGFARFLKLRLFDENFTNYFFHLVIDTMKHRKQHGIIRPDMIQLLMEARKHVAEENENTNLNAYSKTINYEWSDIEIVAQCFVFFVAGFDATSNLMCFLAHELVENPEVQDKLIKEVDEVKEQLGDKPLTYEILKNMKYLDMVVSETSRKWPPAIVMDRVCVKPYKLYDDSTGKEVQINPGDNIWIPVAGLHYDPKYFPNPQRFDPERFSDENKANTNQFAYLPFGVGPRSCIGDRFALMETKAIIARMLMEFTFEASPKTTIPLKLAARGFQLTPKNGFWLKLRPRM